MTNENVAAGGGRRTIGLVLGKTGIHVSVNGGKPSRLPFKGQLNAATLVHALRELFVTVDTPNVDVVLIGTRNDGSPGWNKIDPRELENYAQDSLKITILSEAQALQKSFGQLSGDDHFLIFQSGTQTFRHQAEVLHGGTGSSAYLLFATAGKTELIGSVRCWVQQGESVNLADVHYAGYNAGSIYTIRGGSIVTTPYMVASLVENVLKHYPRVTRVFVWSQDGLNQYPPYAQGGQFWQDGCLRLPEAFTKAGGEIVIVRSALALVSITSAAFAKMAAAPTDNAANGEAGDDKMEND